ncbi:MAG: PIN domain-containing protein [Candidatus Aenigmatarchaeota archaeon]
MSLMVDTNVLMSALISDSTTGRILVTADEKFYAPETVIKEIGEHSELLEKKSGLTEKELSELFERLFKYVQIVPERQFRSYLPRAKDELGETDPDDVVFLAAALAVGCDIWSDDSDLKEQGSVRVFTSSEIVEKF